MAAMDSWLPSFWTAVACNVIAAGLAVLWLKPRVTRLVKEQEAAALQGQPLSAMAAG